MGERVKIEHIRDNILQNIHDVFRNERVQRSLETRGFFRIPSSIITADSEMVERIANSEGLLFVSGRIRTGLATGNPGLRIAAFVYDPGLVKTELLPKSSDVLHEMIPEILRLQDEGFPLFYTDEGSFIIKPIEQDSLPKSA